jgi:hypothetical protein
MKFYQEVQKLLLGNIQAERQTGDLISLLSFVESRLKSDRHAHNIPENMIIAYKITICSIYSLLKQHTSPTCKVHFHVNRRKVALFSTK